MTSKPSCHLYFSFVLHLTGLTALMVGYSTPYWTMVSQPSGEVLATGLVVSCDRSGCRMLHISNARSVLVIVFVMCTASVLISVFVLQVSGLAICNKSCRIRNMGTGLSYFSFFIALLNGATLALYHLEISIERDQDETTISIGWSQYCVIGSSLLYVLGAVLNITDYVKRNRKVHSVAELSTTDPSWKSAELFLQKKSEAQRILVDKTCQTAVSDTTNQQRVNNGGKTFQTAVKKVSSVVKMAAPLTNRNRAYNQDSRIKPIKSIFVVNQGSSDRMNNVISGGISNRYGKTSTAVTSINSTDKNRRGQLVKTENVGSMDMPEVIPSLESDILQGSQESKYFTSRSEGTTAVESKGQSLDKKYDRDYYETKDKIKLRPGNSGREPCRHCARRGSAVEEALLTVSHLLDGAAGNSSQISISEASFSNNDSVTLDLSPQHSVHSDNDRNHKENVGSQNHEKGSRRFARLVRKYSHERNYENASQPTELFDGSQEDNMGKTQQQIVADNRMKRLHVLASMKSNEKKKRKILE